LKIYFFKFKEKDMANITGNLGGATQIYVAVTNTPIAGMGAGAQVIDAKNNDVTGNISAGIGVSSYLSGWGSNVADLAGNTALKNTFGAAGAALGVAQVGVNLYRTDGDIGKLTAGDLLTVATSIVTIAALANPASAVIFGGLAVVTAAGIVYPYLATQTGQTTISDMGQYWKKTLNELAHDIAVGEGLLPQERLQIFLCKPLKAA
jgi:hypothetical protein